MLQKREGGGNLFFKLSRDFEECPEIFITLVTSQQGDDACLIKKRCMSPFPSPSLAHRKMSSGQWPPRVLHRRPTPKESLAAAFAEPFEPLFSSTMAKTRKLPKGKNPFPRSCLKEKAGCQMCCTYMRIHKTKRQPKDNNETQNRQEAPKKSTHASIILLPGGNLRTMDPILYLILYE